MINKKASVTVIVLVVSVLILSSGLIITNEVKKSNNENNIAGTGLVLLDNEKGPSDSSGDEIEWFSFDESERKSSSKKKSSSGGGGSSGSSSNIIETPQKIDENTSAPIENQTFNNNTEEAENLNLLESVNVSNESAESQQGTSIDGVCKKDSKETNEGPGGYYCAYSDYEECYDYGTKSTVIAYGWNIVRGFYEKERGTDYCSDTSTLQEAYLNCGLTTISSDSLKWREKDCNDLDDESDWVYYCTDTQVRKEKHLYTYGCSDGACNIVSSRWVDDTLVSKKGDGDYCTKRKQYTDAGATGCTLCGYEDYDCDFDSQCSGNLECKGPILDLNPSYYDGCCRSDEDWDSNTKRCVAQQECTSGVCCDDYYYRPSNYVCDNHYGNYNYDCSDGQCLGSDVKKQDRRRYCSGESASCNGEFVWNSWQVHDACGSSEFCDSSSAGNTPFSCSQAQCTSGVCCNTNCGEYNFLPSTNTCDSDGEYRCSNGGGPPNPGSDIQTRIRYQSCSGSSSSCGGDYGGWGDWFTLASCTLDEYCSEPEITCVSCGYNTNYNCYNSDVYWYDDCNNREGKKEECGTIGCSNGKCNSAIECSSNAECGTDGYVGNPICSENDLYQDYRAHTCDNPGTTSSSCSYSDTSQKKQECGEDETGNNYCSNDDVYQNITDRGCSSGSCFEDTAKEKVEECGTLGCSEGKCVSAIECSSNSDCGTDGYVGEEFCSNGDLYWGYEVYTCHNKGTTSSYCTSDDTPIIARYCGKDEIGSNYCSNNDVYRDFIDRGCSNKDCFENITPQKVEDCGVGQCVAGICEGIEKPDLTITDLVVQNINGRSVTLAFKVKNIGDLVATRVSWMVDTDSRDTNPQRTIPTTLNPGDWTRAYMMWTYSQSGNYNPEAIVDFDGVVSESNEDNNKQTISVVV